jgi:hypothetical protein
MTKLDDALELVPMWKSLIFSIALSSTAIWSSESIFIFWKVKYAFCSTKSLATIEKAIASRLPVSSETITGSMYLENVVFISVFSKQRNKRDKK